MSPTPATAPILRRRSQKSILRPIDHIGEFRDLLSNVVLTIGEESATTDSGAIYLSQTDLRSAPIALKVELTGKSSPDPLSLAQFEAMLAKLDLGLDDVRFVVVGQTSFLKLERELVRLEFPIHRVGEPFGGPIQIEIAKAGQFDRAEVLQAVSHGFDIHVMVVLAESREPQLRMAWRKGTILDRQSFKVRSFAAGDFVPEPLTDEIRTNQDLPSDTYQYIEVHIAPWSVDRIDECVRTYLDADLLTFLDGNSARQKAAQDDLARDVIREIFAWVRSSEDRPKEWDPEYGRSVLGALLRLVTPGTKSKPKLTEAEMYAMLINHPAKLAAFLDSSTKARKNAATRLRGEEK
jgi:hypothetical protein